MHSGQSPQRGIKTWNTHTHTHAEWILTSCDGGWWRQPEVLNGIRNHQQTQDEQFKWFLSWSRWNVYFKPEYSDFVLEGFGSLSSCGAAGIQTRRNFFITLFMRRVLKRAAAAWRSEPDRRARLEWWTISTKPNVWCQKQDKTGVIIMRYNCTSRMYRSNKSRKEKLFINIETRAETTSWLVIGMHQNTNSWMKPKPNIRKQFAEYWTCKFTVLPLYLILHHCIN